MPSLRDVILKRRAYEVARFAQQQVAFFGTIVSLDGSSDVPNTPDHVIVQPNGIADTVGVLNRRVKPNVGMGVVCGFEPYSTELEILRQDISTLAGVTPIAGLNVPVHGSTHLIDGDDPVPVYSNAIMVLLTYTLGLTGLVVNVSPYVYEVDGEIIAFPGEENYSLASHQPAVGLALYVLVYLDLDTNELATLAGPTTVDSPAYTPAPPTVPENVVPSALVRLDGSQTEVAFGDILPVADFLYGSSRMRGEFGSQMIHRLAILENEIDAVLNRHIVQGW